MIENNTRAEWLAANKPFLTAHDVSQLLNVTLNHVYKMARQNRIPSLKLGRYRRFRAIDILLWVETQGGRF
jgi:excisionase family DNA binding protein